MIECPPWWSDKDEHDRPECFATIQRVVVQACTLALRSVPRRRDLAQWHRDSFRAVVPLPYYAGSFRQHDLKRPCLGRDLEIGGLPAVPHQHVLGEVEKLSDFVVRELTETELRWTATPLSERARRVAIIVGTAIGRFIHIHPFLNGNGRISRVFWTVLLARLGLPAQFSVVRRPEQPYGDVMRAAMTGDYAPAIKMVLTALARGPLPPLTLPTSR